MLGLFSFQGRTNRLGYLLNGLVQFALFVGLVAVIVGMVVSGLHKPASGGAMVGGLAMILLGLVAVIWVGLAATVRRLRDMGWPVTYGLMGLFGINFLGRLALQPIAQGLMTGHAGPVATWTVILLTSFAASFVLVLWPSAKDIQQTDLDEVFGEDLTPDLPPADWAQMHARQEAAKPAVTATPPPPRRPEPVRAPSGEGPLPRATFGLRQSY